MITHPVYVFTFNQKTLVSKETLLDLGSIVIEVHGCLLKSTVSSFLKRGPVDASPKARYPLLWLRSECPKVCQKISWKSDTNI